MILEIEIIEQIADQPQGRSFEWLREFIRSNESRDPNTILMGMWKAGKIEVRDNENHPYDQWKIEELFRNNAFTGSERVTATRLGLKVV
jgi:hypothetical protein